jgi:hypothetical protein
MQVPSHAQARIVLCRANGVGRPRLADHQTGPMQHAPAMGLDDGPIHLPGHPQIVCDENYFSVAHI